LLAGAVLAADPELIQSLTGVRALLGNILQADECWILDSRLSTVGLRMNRQSKNAQRIAEELAKNRQIAPSLVRIAHATASRTSAEVRRIGILSMCET